ncbi:alpha/beta fold hydrolase [Spelaeicoccus albus]|uniref:Pimeloyl-ACP methyl ester carboxylesterase n=1 Tax=Spelaeicoccus albus TaxID=1280376 RepID=A0A7Z0A878_9MICO|nr:alpha/beta hydrolase [Spelaeicoccus albus]NYI66224.1 pimeloyl-ACP methyl ester carboxylesterase [Spelaeicoccus albus]
MAFAWAPDGTRIRYWTSGAGTPILLIAGQALPHSSWGTEVDRLASRHTVVTYDHRGVGESDGPVDEPYTTRGMAADAVAILDDLGIDRAHVYGFSMGGRIAQWLAADHPDRVGALVLGSTTPGDAHGVRRSRRATQILIGTDRRALLELFYTPEWIDANDMQSTAPLAKPHNRQTLALHYKASEGHDGWDALSHIAAPTLVVHGSDDELAPVRNASIAAERIPDSRLVILDGARHGYFAEFPDVSDTVLDFIAGHGRGAVTA